MPHAGPNLGLGIGDWGFAESPIPNLGPNLGIGDWGLGIRLAQSPIPNPQSPDLVPTWGLGIGDGGLGIGDSPRPIPNPQIRSQPGDWGLGESPIPNPLVGTG